MLVPEGEGEGGEKEEEGTVALDQMGCEGFVCCWPGRGGVYGFWDLGWVWVWEPDWEPDWPVPWPVPWPPP